MFLSILKLLWYVMIVGRMTITVKCVPDVSWLVSCEQLMFLTRFELQGFVTRVERLVIGPESVLDKDLLVNKHKQICRIEL